MTTTKNMRGFYMIFVVIIYFFSSISVHYIMCYEYIFSNKNNTKEYVLTSDRRTLYAYITLEQDMYKEESQGYDFRVKEAFEDKRYFIGLDYEKNKNEILEKHYIVVDKINTTMKKYSDKEFKKKFKNVVFEEVQLFLKTRGTKVGWKVNII